MKRQVHVVVADDKHSTRRGLKALLAFFPEIEVIGEAANGREAVELAAAYHPDVVLMDLQMPLLDGMQAAQLIKDQSPDIRIVVLTFFLTCRAEAIQAGVDAFLLKGCTNEALRAAILNSANLDTDQY